MRLKFAIPLVIFKSRIWFYFFFFKKIKDLDAAFVEG